MLTWIFNHIASFIVGVLCGMVVFGFMGFIVGAIYALDLYDE